MVWLLISFLTSFQQVVNVEPTANIAFIVGKAFIGCSAPPQRKFTSGNVIKLNKYHTMLTYYRLLTCIMPQVLQELIDSPVGTSNEYLSISFFSVLSKVKRIILISAFNSCLLYLLFVNHNHFTLMNLTLFLSLRSLGLHLMRLQQSTRRS